MNWLRWVGVRLLDQAGWQGACGLMLFLVCGLYYLGAVRPLHDQMNAVRAVAAATERLGVQPEGSVANVDAQLAAFRRTFDGEPLERHLSVIHETAKAMGVGLKRMEYRMLEHKRGQLYQYQITMPVSQSYPRVRQFLSLVLAKVPSMSLDHISFQRKTIGDGMVDVELRFTLFLAPTT